jgi:rare lipoprotein A
MAGGGVEENLQARAAGRLAARALAVTFAGVKALATLRSEKDPGADRSAVFVVWSSGRRAFHVRRLAGVDSALSLAILLSDVRDVRAGLALGLACLALAGCAQTPAPVAHHRYRGHEHFAEGFYGKASPRVYEDGQAIPRGGGQYLVGHPYHIAGRWYYPRENDHYLATGTASWYGDAFHGRKTANGEIYDKLALTAAHPTMPLPSYARVTNLGNGYSVIVRVNDRGPYAAGRVMDVSSRVADVLDFKRRGTARVKVEYVGRAPLEGSDDNELLATLRTDGSPANLGGATMVAEAGSPLGFLFGSKPAPEPPPPPPPPPEPAPVAAPEAEPRQVETPRAEARQTEPERATRRRPAPEIAPLPPARPFDLGAQRQAALAPTPPRRRESDRALYFAAPRTDPLAHLLRARPIRALVKDDEN